MTNWRHILSWQVEPEPVDPMYSSHLLAKVVVEDMLEDIPQLIINKLDVHIVPGETDFEKPLLLRKIQRYMTQYINSLVVEDIFAA